MPLEPIDFVRSWFPAHDGSQSATSSVADLLALMEGLRSKPNRRPELERFHDAISHHVAAQILSRNPPSVWDAARRMTEAGIEPTAAGGLLELTLTGQIAALPEGGTEVDLESYRSALDALPPPSDDDIAEAMVEIVNRHRVTTLDGLRDELFSALHLPGAVAPFQTIVDRMLETLISDDGPLRLLTEDRVVDRRQLTADVVLTHQVTRDEITDDILDATVDLEVIAPDDEFEVVLEGIAGPGEAVPVHVDDAGPRTDPERRRLWWHGPDDWLSQCPDGAVVAVRRQGGSVLIEALPAEPEPDAALVESVRAAYDGEVAEPGLPAAVMDVVLTVLVDHPDAFAVPRPPLCQIFAAAGLEIRGSELAHDPELWSASASLRRLGRVAGRLNHDWDGTRRVVELVECYLGEDRSSAALRPCLETLADPELLEVATDELCHECAVDQASLDRLGAFTRSLVQRASAATHVAAARYLEAVVAETHEDPLAAHAALEIAVEADPHWVPGVARLAWYRSDRGDADGALQLFAQLEREGITSSDRRVIERALGHVGTSRGTSRDQSPGQATGQPAGKPPGRNTPCWCGSGRKFKHCHFGQATMPPLEERAEWLYQKAVNYVHHGQRESRSDLVSVALARAGLDTSDDMTLETLQGEVVKKAAGDPLVLDLVLSEMGWFSCFLADRSALLPDDEALMGEAWELTDRTLYEIVAARPGEGLTLRDLRSAETVEVRERSFSQQGRVGMVFCGRAVPVGSTHQLIGGLFLVPPGQEADVLDLLDEADAIEIAAYIARSERPTVLQNREGEPLTLQTVTVKVADRVAMREVLARHYEPDDSPPDTDDPAGSATRWVELHDIGGGENVLRARLRLVDDELTIETNSEARAERVLGVLTGEVGPIELVSRKSTPMRTFADAAAARPGGATPKAPQELSDEERAAVEEWRARYEERWCDEAIPALQGLTPRQAAADPSRRESLERLLLSFEHDFGGDPEGAPTFTMRPARLRSLLGIGDPDAESLDGAPAPGGKGRKKGRER